MGKLAHVVDVQNTKSIGEMLSQSQTNYSPVMVPAEVNGAKAGGFKAIIRPDINEVIGTVASRYRMNDHRAHLMALEPAVQSGMITPASVSMWDNGAVLAYQFRVSDLDAVIQGAHGKDMVSPLLTLAFAYGFPLSDSAFFADFRWFCKNQLGKVAELTKGCRVQHKGDVNSRYAELLGSRVKELGGELAGRYEAMRRMTGTTLQGRALVEYVGQVIQASQEDVERAWVAPKEECRGNAARIHEVIECHAVDDCNAPGTVYHAYNALTRWQSHHAGRNEATRTRSMLLGAGSNTAARAWETAARMVG